MSLKLIRTYFLHFQRGNDSNGTVPSNNTTIHHFILGVISDNDEKSVSQSKPNTWESKFVQGKLIWDDKNRNLSVTFDTRNTKVLRSGFNAGGRGMELSELIYYDSVLTAFDDKTGIVYKIENEVFPWVILAAGDGKLNKGFKAEWATVKNNKLIVGSHGTKFKPASNKRQAEVMEWIKMISFTGEVEHVNWTENYEKIRNSTECVGYIIHEAVCWSEIHGKWFFLPRKCSKEPYSKETYDKKCSNILISVDEAFEKFHITQVGESVPSQGFSSFKFLPGSNDSIIIALKTMEVKQSSKTYLSAYSLEGEILIEDTLISDIDKFEGLEFIHPYDPILNYVAPDPKPSSASNSITHLSLSLRFLSFVSSFILIFFNQINSLTYM